MDSQNWTNVYASEVNFFFIQLAWTKSERGKKNG